MPDNIEQLQDILKYHVVAGSYPSSSLTSGDVETLNGDSVAITVSDSGVMVNDANVVTPDIMASNGIIHVIDKVLLPPPDEEPATTAATEPAVPDTMPATAGPPDQGMLGGKSGKSSKSSKAKTLKE